MSSKCRMSHTTGLSVAATIHQERDLNTSTIWREFSRGKNFIEGVYVCLYVDIIHNM